ncbi:hypothetical protein GCM10010275_51960 [Streptomyces litmocidini]|nr:hypothetical protein GCM10010275_51960 [Streptomyces litmocidini]
MPERLLRRPAPVRGGLVAARPQVAQGRLLDALHVPRLDPPVRLRVLLGDDGEGGVLPEQPAHPAARRRVEFADQGVVGRLRDGLVEVGGRPPGGLPVALVRGRRLGIEVGAELGEPRPGAALRGEPEAGDLQGGPDLAEVRDVGRRELADHRPGPRARGHQALRDQVPQGVADGQPAHVQLGRDLALHQPAAGARVPSMI